MDELDRLGLEEFRKEEKLPVVVVLDDVRSMHNVGSVFRTADAFRVAKIFLCGITGKPPHREIQKTALGATESVAWEYFEDVTHCLEKLRKQGYSLTGVEQTDQSLMLHEWKPTKHQPCALIFGNEVSGLSDDVLPLLDIALEIPQGGTKHSLNVAVSAGVVIWELFSQWK